MDKCDFCQNEFEPGDLQELGGFGGKICTACLKEQNGPAPEAAVPAPTVARALDSLNPDRQSLAEALDRNTVALEALTKTIQDKLA